MGWRKYRLVLWFCVIVCFSCVTDNEISISECNFTETGFNVTIKSSSFVINTISSVELQVFGSKETILFEENTIRLSKSNSKLILDIDATGKRIPTNIDYELIVKIPGGFIVARIFIGNPVTPIMEVYDFPGEAYKSVKIIVFDSFYVYGM